MKTSVSATPRSTNCMHAAHRLLDVQRGLAQNARNCQSGPHAAQVVRAFLPLWSSSVCKLCVSPTHQATMLARHAGSRSCCRGAACCMLGLPKEAGPGERPARPFHNQRSGSDQSEKPMCISMCRPVRQAQFFSSNDDGPQHVYIDDDSSGMFGRSAFGRNTGDCSSASAAYPQTCNYRMISSEHVLIK